MDEEIQKIEKLGEAVEGVKKDVDGRLEAFQHSLDAIDKKISEQTETFKHSMVDDKTSVVRVITGIVKGEINPTSDTFRHSLDSGFLREEKATEILPELVDDIERLFRVKPTDAQSTSNGLGSASALSRNLSESSEFAPISVGVTLDAYGQYLYYSESEAQMADIDVAKEIANSFVDGKKKALLANFVDGDGTYFKGLKDYTASTTWESGKLQTYTAGASGTATVAQVYAKIVEAMDAMRAGDKYVMMKPSLISSFRTTSDGDNHYYYALLENLGLEVVPNDSMEAIAAEAYAAAIGVKGRGYGIAKGKKLIVTRNTVANKINVYTGINLGGAMLDHKALACVKVAAA